MSNLPIENSDDAVLRMLSGATFGSDASVILPSGRKISGTEAQAFASAFSDTSQDDEQPRLERDTPLSSRYDDWTGDPETDRARLLGRALEADRQRRATEKRRPWWQFWKQ